MLHFVLGRCTVCYGGVLYGRAVYCVVGYVLCGREVYCMLWYLC